MSAKERADALRAAARLLRLARELNVLRPPDHRDRISYAVADTQEYFRASPEAGLPAPGEDALFDLVQTLASGCEASPEGFARICDDLQEIVEQQEGAAS
jgi:hypothetical protein